VSGVRLRRAAPADIPFLVKLTTHEEVEPYLGTRTARDAGAVLAEVERSTTEPMEFGRFVIEVEQDGGWQRAGGLGFHAASPQHRIAAVERLAILPDFRGRGLADEAARLLQRLLLAELGYHRLELECYGFNGRAIRHAERAGWIREGVKRKAYWRHGEWVDGVLFALLREDLEQG
jgi:RimJ/RimL family protein N-acetyltransferase